MNRQLFAAAILAAFSTGTAKAQEFKGDITLGFSAFWDDTRVSALSGTGAFEFGITDRASVQVDAGLYGFNGVLVGSFSVADVLPDATNCTITIAVSNGTAAARTLTCDLVYFAQER